MSSQRTTYLLYVSFGTDSTLTYFSKRYGIVYHMAGFMVFAFIIELTSAQ